MLKKHYSVYGIPISADMCKILALLRSVLTAKAGVCANHTKEFYYSSIIPCFRINFVLVGISHNITLPQSWRTPVQMTYYASTTAMSSLSIIGCLIIMYYYATLKQLRNRSRQLLICLTVCDLLIAVGNIIGISL